MQASLAIKRIIKYQRITISKGMSLESPGSLGGRIFIKKMILWLRSNLKVGKFIRTFFYNKNCVYSRSSLGHWKRTGPLMAKIATYYFNLP
jgi:hypothetical protein